MPARIDIESPLFFTRVVSPRRAQVSFPPTSSALLFFNRQMKVVSLDDRSAACDFLGLTAAERTTADRVRSELEAEIGLSMRASERGSAG
jgi:hypothetical protein